MSAPQPTPELLAGLVASSYGWNPNNWAKTGCVAPHPTEDHGTCGADRTRGYLCNDHHAKATTKARRILA